MARTVLVAAGGTGGHLFPGIAVADELVRRDPQTRVVFAGTPKGLESRLVPRAGYALELLPILPLNGVGVLRMLKGLVALPWGLVLTGGGLTLGAMLCGASGLAFAIGVYLPLASMAALYVGGCVRRVVERKAGKPSEGSGDAGVLAASGLVAREGLAGVVVAALVASGVAPRSMTPHVGGVAGSAAVSAVILATCALLWLAGRARRTGPPAGGPAAV